MNADSDRRSLLYDRMLNLASIGLLASMIFGLAKLGFGVVPVWILAVPFVLLASLDMESCFSRARTFSARLMSVAFHFVIIATVFAAHQQIGEEGAGASVSRTEAAMASKSGAWGCAAGGCGSAGSGASGGGCGAACGGAGGGTLASSTTGAKSACGCGGGKAATSSSSRPAGPTNATASKRSQANRVAFPLPVTRPALPGTEGTASLPLPGNAVGPKLGAGLVPVVGATREPPVAGAAPSSVVAPVAAPKAPIAVPAIFPPEPPRTGTTAADIVQPKLEPVQASTPPSPSSVPAPSEGGKTEAPSPEPAAGKP